jgi:4-amino-4-deoxy-L-arabinose transferase-like glycosyltransferase
VRVFRHFLLLTAICLLTFFAGLGRSAIGDSDEAFYAESAREMIESGDWVTPHYNYEYRFQKPILYYWLVATTYFAAGTDEAAARFPSALAGLALTLLTYFCGRRWFSERIGLLAGVIVGTSFGYFYIARASLPDLPLAFFIALATFTLSEGVLGPPETSDAARGSTSASRRLWLLAAGAAMALAVLTKGPVGVALPLIVVLPLALLEGKQWRPSGQGWFGVRWTDMLLAAAVFLAIALPWFIAMVGTHGTAYLNRFFIGENLERFATERYNERRSFGFYIPIVLGGLGTWAPFVFLWIPFGLKWLRRERKLSQVEWRVALWAMVPFLFYTLSIGKQPRYILPILPPLALFVGRTILDRIARSSTNGQRHNLWLGVCASFSALILIILAVLLYRARPLLFALSPTSGLISTLVIVVSGLGLAATAWFARARLLPAALAGASVAALVALHYSVYSAAGLEPVQRMARLFAEERRAGEPSGTYKAFVRNLVFYTGVKQTDLVDEQEAVEFLKQPHRVLCVMTEDDLVPLERSSGLRLRRLGAVLYFNPAGVRLKTLLSPEPERDLETVWLVSNQ